MCYKRNIGTLFPNNFCRGKSIMISYSDCVSVAVVIQHTTHVRHIIDCGMYNSTIFFPHYLINATMFGTKLLNIKLCFDFLYNFCLKHFLALRTERGITINILRSSCKVPVILVRF